MKRIVQPPTFNDIFGDESCSEHPTHIIDDNDNPFTVNRSRKVAPPPPPSIEPVSVNNPGTLFGEQDTGLDPLVQELLQQVKKLEDDNAELREDLQDEKLRARKLENMLQQTQRALNKLNSFLGQHRGLFTG